MKFNFFKFLHKRFQLIGWYTFIVYFIFFSICWFNFIKAFVFNENYFPLRSYLVTFSNNEILNNSKILKGIYNLAGYKAQIVTDIPYKLIDDLYYFISVTALLVLFFAGYKAVKAFDIKQNSIINWSLIFSFLMAFTIPNNSSDLYGYIARGAQQSIFNVNPYFHSVSEIDKYNLNPMFANFMWTNQPTSYGPLFIGLCRAITMLSNNDFFTSLVNFKLLNLTVVYLFLLFLQRSNFSKEAVYLISWNPLVMIHGLWNCHNDLISGILIFCGFYLLVKAINDLQKINIHFFIGSFCLMISIGIKYLALITLPIIFTSVIKEKTNFKSLLYLSAGVISGLLLIGVFLIPYFEINGFNNLEKIITNINLMHKSLISTLYSFFNYLLGWLQISFDKQFLRECIKNVIYFGYLIFYLWIVCRKRNDLIFDSVLVIFVFLCFTISKFHSWYLLNLIFLIPILSERDSKSKMLGTLLMFLSLTHSYSITFIDQAKILNFIIMTLIPVIFVLIKSRRK